MSEWNFDPGVIVFVGAVALTYAWGLWVDPKSRRATGDRRGFDGPEGARPCAPTEVTGDDQMPADNRTPPPSTADFSPLPTGKGAFAAAGIITLIVALISPLDFLADRVLFFAHMAQHLLLLLVAPTFLVLGAPTIVADLVRRGASYPGGRLLLSPPVALLVSMGTLWAWHVPRLYDAAIQNNLTHALQHGSFLATSLLFWWPVLRSHDLPRRVPDLAFLLYLFAAAVGSSLLAAFIALSPVPLYAVGGSGVVPGLALPRFGLSPLEDQQLGGFLMWGMGSLWYFGVAAMTFVGWVSRAMKADQLATDLVVDQSGAVP